MLRKAAVCKGGQPHCQRRTREGCSHYQGGVWDEAPAESDRPGRPRSGRRPGRAREGHSRWQGRGAWDEASAESNRPG